MCLSYNWSNIFKVIIRGRKIILPKSVSHDDKFDHKELNVLISVKSCREKLQKYTYLNKAFFFKILNQDQGKKPLQKIVFKRWKHRKMEVSKFYCTTTSLFHNILLRIFIVTRRFVCAYIEQTNSSSFDRSKFIINMNASK